MFLRRTIAATLCAFTYHAILICCLAGCAEDRAEATTNDPGVRLLESVAELATLPVGQGVSPCSGFKPSGSATTYWLNEQTVQFALGPWDVPVTLPVGTVLSGFAVGLIDNGGATPNTVQIEIMSSTAGQLGSITSLGNGNEQAWTSSWATSHTVVGGEVLWFRASPRLAGGAYASANSTLEGLSLWVGAPALHTVIIPIQPETNTRGVNLATNGMGNVISGNVSDPNNGFVEYIPLMLSVGTHIGGWRVRVQDSQFGGGSSRISSQLMTTTNNQNIPSTIATSSLSSGVGAEETISATVSLVAAPSTQYWISVYDQVGTASGFVRRLEIDVN